MIFWDVENGPVMKDAHGIGELMKIWKIDVPLLKQLLNLERFVWTESIWKIEGIIIYFVRISKKRQEFLDCKYKDNLDLSSPPCN